MNVRKKATTNNTDQGVLSIKGSDIFRGEIIRDSEKVMKYDDFFEYEKKKDTRKSSYNNNSPGLATRQTAAEWAQSPHESIVKTKRF